MVYVNGSNDSDVTPRMTAETLIEHWTIFVVMTLAHGEENKETMSPVYPPKTATVCPWGWFTNDTSANGIMLHTTG